MRVENAPLVRTHGATYLALDLEDLVSGLDQGLFEPIDLLAELGFRYSLPVNAGSGASQHKDLPPRNPRRYWDATEGSLTLMRRFGHTESLTKTDDLEKQIFAGKNLPSPRCLPFTTLRYCHFSDMNNRRTNHYQGLLA